MRRIQSQKRGCIEFSLALDELAEILPSGEQIEKTVEQRELMQMLRTFLATIKPESYQLFMERYYLAKSVQAIAESHQISEAKVKVTLLRIRRKLKDYLRNEGLL